MKGKLDWVYGRMLEMDIEVAMEEFKRPEMSRDQWNESEKHIGDLQQAVSRHGLIVFLLAVNISHFRRIATWLQSLTGEER